MITPDQFPNTPVYDLLHAAANGLIGIDQRLIRAIIDRGEAAVPDLLRFAEEELDEDDPVNLEEDLIAIFRYLKSPQALPFYVDCIRRQPDEIPDDLVEAFHEIGAPAIEPLLALHEELGEEQGAEIVFLLATLRVHDDRVFHLLLDHLEYDLADGAFCLGLYGDPAARPALEKALTELDADDPEMSGLRQDISEALERLDEPPVPPHDEPFDLWDLYPETAEPQLDILSAADRLKLLESESEEQRAAAAASFFNQELSAEARQALYDRARNDSSAAVRARSWEALADTDEPAIRQAMKARLTAPDASIEERAGALLGLYSDMDDAVVFEQAKELYQEASARAKVLEAMWRSLDRRFSAFFPPHLDDANEDVRREAIRGVGYLGVAAEVGKLEKLFEDEEYRPDALFSYALATPAQISRGRIRSVFRRIDERAGGLSPAEAELVQFALDERLALHGLAPVFFPDDEDEEVPDEPELAAVAAGPKVGRNDPCPCGSGKKYKKCCGQS